MPQAAAYGYRVLQSVLSSLYLLQIPTVMKPLIIHKTPSNAEKNILILDPVRIVDTEWEDGRLKIKLNHVISNQWIETFRNIGGFSYIMRSEPGHWVFRKDTASVDAPSNSV